MADKNYEMLNNYHDITELGYGFAIYPEKAIVFCPIIGDSKKR